MAIELTADLEATSYATVEQADAEAALRRGVILAAWDALGDDDKLAALIAATRDLDTLDWIGDRASDAQELEWPRTDTDFSDDAWPRNLVRATMELAFSYAVAGTVGDDATTDPLAVDVATPNIKREKVSVIETEYFAPTSTPADQTTVDRFPPLVQNLLTAAGLIRTPSESAWGSSVARRAS